MKIVDKVAFLVHEPVVYSHYSSVWAEMKRDSFAIILFYDFDRESLQKVPGANDVIRKIVENGYEFHYFNDLRRDNIKFKYVVSNHKISGKTSDTPSARSRLSGKIKVVAKQLVNFALGVANRPKKYFIKYNYSTQFAPLQVGLRQIRFMYGADIGDGWSLQDWNEIYDLFLCHGPNDEAQLRKRFRGKTEVMGYPRYDGYFSPDLDVGPTIREFGIKPDRETILWMPTLGDDANSIPFFANAVSKLSSEYNVIVRPHPISFRLEPQKIDMLKSLSFVIDDDSTRDMNELFKVADIILCDYGGSAFGAIYLGKKLILLDVPGSEKQYTVVNSSNLELREHITTLDADNAFRLKSVLEDDSEWEKQSPIRRKLFLKYFADTRGSSSKRAAKILMNLDSVFEA